MLHVNENISLKDKNWFKTGGNARYYIEPNNPEEFAESLQFAKNNNLEIFILGEGANVLISDEGFDGLIIRPKLKKISHEALCNDDYLVKVESGRAFQELIDYCLENQLVGLEEFSGIPGTVGGSIYINIHYFEYLLSQFLVSATVVEKTDGKIYVVDNCWFNFGYNKSILQNKDFFLIDATFKLKRVDKLKAAYSKGKRDEIIRHRSRRYPNQGTCGSFFRNFYDNEVTMKIADKKMIYVAYYLDKIGVKGNLRFGNAIVSHQHANMIVNLSGALSEDIINLAKQMQLLVQEHFNIVPQPECQFVGFKQYPLL